MELKFCMQDPTDPRTQYLYEAIVAAVENGDAEGARQAMIKHLAFSREVLEDISKSHTDQKP